MMCNPLKIFFVVWWSLNVSKYVFIVELLVIGMNGYHGNHLDGSLNP